ncbi:MAG: ABC transporter permease [Candidatus Cloacimonetes bacterium]|nr:ABC transporter permease [Candidatus Cloacimonadota bacterium]
MYIKDAFSSSLQTIFSHKIRSFLTILGIMIGVAAVVTMFSSVYGLKNLIHRNIEGMGWNNSLIIVTSDNQRSGMRRRRNSFMYINREIKGLKFSDFEYLKIHIKHHQIYGMIESWQRFIIENKQNSVNMRATNTDFFLNKTFPLAEGRFFNRFEEEAAEKVCILGYHFAEKNFEDSPLNKMITIGEHRYKIIGVLDNDEINNNGFSFNPWERRRDLSMIYIPLSTGAKYYRSDRNIDYVYIQSSDEAGFNQMKNDVRQALLMLHNMSHDFSFQDIGAEMVKVTTELNEMLRKWNITLTAIASVSLIVGGIGLFSTLMISISERMMEIGVRKSIGAKENDIFVYFIIEAISLALMGAAVGILISGSLIAIIARTASVEFPIPPQGVILGIVFAVTIGFLSGIYPAIKAARIDPIQAIYYFE